MGTIYKTAGWRAVAGATSPQLRQREHATKSVLQHVQSEMIKAIREAGRTPVQRNTFYEPIKVWDDAPTAKEVEPVQQVESSRR